MIRHPRTRPALLIATLVLLGAACTPKESPEPVAEPGDPVDLIFLGGAIYTGVDAAPRAEAVAVDNGVVVAVGGRADVETLAGPNTRVIDLEGAAMYPGFTDSHAHFLGIGMRELTLNLEGVSSVEELVDVIAANVEESGEGAVISGNGWIETGWPEARFPNRHDLDPVSPRNPVILGRADGHAVLVNSAALAAAGVDASTPDPEGGRIERDAEGQPTGILIDNAIGLVSGLVAAPTDAQKREAYRVASTVYAAYGWTGVHNMSAEYEDLAVIEDLSDEGDIKIRVYNSVDKPHLDALIAGGHRQSDNGRVITRALKLYVDGALGSRGAALFEPYADQPDTSGLLLLEKDEALAMFDRAITSGVQVNTHAIGDRGNQLALDWYEEAFAKNPGAGDLRWRIEHFQVARPEEFARFAELGVIASMQPSHAIGDLHFAPARLGPDRLAGAYAWRSVLDAGGRIAGGSDAPVERGDPLIEFYAAVERRSLDGFQGEGWHPEQVVTREEALEMFTSAPAYASFGEGLVGVIEPGKRADFTVFSKDIMTVPASEILSAKAVMTVVDGVIVYHSADEQ